MTNVIWRFLALACAFALLAAITFSATSSASTTPSTVTYRMKYRMGTTKTNDVYKLGDFNITIDNLDSTNLQYTSNLSRAFVCTHDKTEYTDGLALALMNSDDKRHMTFVNFSTNQTGIDANYTIELRQDAQEGRALIAFTKGDCDNINNKSYLVENQGLPTTAFSDFNLQSGAQSLIQLSLVYDRLVINGSDWFGAGDNKVCVEHLATAQSNLPMIGVYRC